MNMPKQTRAMSRMYAGTFCLFIVFLTSCHALIRYLRAGSLVAEIRAGPTSLLPYRGIYDCLDLDSTYASVDVHCDISHLEWQNVNVNGKVLATNLSGRCAAAECEVVDSRRVECHLEFSVRATAPEFP